MSRWNILGESKEKDEAMATVGLRYVYKTRVAAGTEPGPGRA